MAPLPETSFPFELSDGAYSAFDPDFWDPNILSTTNWLDAVIDDEFQGLQFDHSVSNPTVPDVITSKEADTSSVLRAPRRSGLVGSTPSIVSSALSSNVSGRSGLSTETAADICAAQESHSEKAGEYYVDGQAARLPRTKRRKLSSHKRLENSSPQPQSSPFSLRLASSTYSDTSKRIHVPDFVYEQFSNIWQTTCIAPQSIWPAFELSEFPIKDTFEHLIGLYFAHFHQTLPFLHPPTFDISKVSSLFLLAMASVGAHFLQDDTCRFAASLSEMVRRSLVIANETGTKSSSDPVDVAATQMLLSVSLVYSGDPLTVLGGLEMGSTLASRAFELAREANGTPAAQVNSEDTSWTAWIRREHVTRIFYSIWLLDCMWAYQFQRSPLLELEHARLPLPCHEKSWRANNAEDWKNLSSGLLSATSLNEALQELYIDKRLPKERGEFARIIIIHGLFQRTWEVERYYRDPLSHWVPTAKKQSSRDILPEEPISLSSIPTVAKWQNSVCDCIDILHWQANATIGQASGLEHPTVAFLHLSRVVLLSPVNIIVTYAKAIIGKVDSTTPDSRESKEIIRRWAIQGQYKARLAAIHAGVVLWHVRRYSIDGFYEGPAVGLAALMLWAFGQFAPRPTSQDQSNSTKKQAMSSNGDDSQNETSDDSACEIILLDRPTDDELVQQFIRRGNTMQAHITGVGDLYGPEGPQRVLIEGCKLLQSLKCWPNADTWLVILQRLHQNRSNHS